MLRPRAARWFEILAARDDATLVLESLARTGAVELEARASAGLPAALADVLPALSQFLELQTRYHAWWPPAATCRPSAFPEAPVLTLQRCLAVVRAWALDAEPVIQALQHAQGQQHELALWQQVLPALQARPLDAAQLAQAGPWIGVRLFVLPPGCSTEALWPGGAPPGGVATLLAIDERLHLLVAAPPEALQAVAQAVGTLKGTAHAVPPWFGSDLAANLAALQQRQATLQQQIEQHQQALATLQARHDLPRALGDAHRLQWVLQNVRALESGELLCWITGWCADADGRALASTLQASGARALLHFAAPPAAAQAPLLLDNPRWARPFELFARALGMPAAAEVDPSPVLALAVPLMFGYMFGDVGQGLVIAVLAWWFRERFPLSRLLMIGGLSAAVFGLLFGSVFGLHGLLPALWLHPLDAPLAVLMAPLVGGVLLLTLGLLLDALQAAWRDALRPWLLTDAALVALYLALLGAFFDPRALWLAVLALAWFCAGHALAAKRLSAGFAALGEAVEKTLQILINTLSFARVGAFALAHAGLSSAIVALMEAADSLLVRALVLLLGNLLVIVLEAMVVSIQTTRLVLFEFFTRFMQGQGRAFRPLPAPPYPLQES